MKIFGGGKLEHYNSIGGTTKKKWGRNFEISVGESKTGTRFLTQVHWGGILEENMITYTNFGNIMRKTTTSLVLF